MSFDEASSSAPNHYEETPSYTDLNKMKNAPQEERFASENTSEYYNQQFCFNPLSEQGSSQHLIQRMPNGEGFQMNWQTLHLLNNMMKSVSPPDMSQNMQFAHRPQERNVKMNEKSDVNVNNVNNKRKCAELENGPSPKKTISLKNGSRVASNFSKPKAEVVPNSQKINDALKRCVEQGTLDVSKAGKVLVSSLLMREPISEGLEMFANLEAETIKSTVLGNNFDVSDPNASLMISLGTYAKSVVHEKKLSILEVKMKKLYVANDRIELNDVRGNSQYVKKEHIIKGCRIFKETKLDLSQYPIPRRPEAHIVLLHYLRCIFENLTVITDDIQNYTKVDRKSPKTPTGSRKKDLELLPDHIYDTLFAFFREYFNLEHPELTLPWNADVEKSKWYSELGVPEKRYEMFSKLADARFIYDMCTFKVQLKQAL